MPLLARKRLMPIRILGIAAVAVLTNVALGQSPGAEPARSSVLAHAKLIHAIAEFEAAARTDPSASTANCMMATNPLSNTRRCVVAGCVSSRSGEADRCRIGREVPCRGPDTDSRLAACDRDSAETAQDSQRVHSHLARLLRTLDSAGRVNPADAWIRGQLMYYLVATGRLDSAIATAQACTVPAGRCAQYLGYARARAGDWRAADSAFSNASNRSPASERCAAEDLSLIVKGDGEFLKAYSQLACGTRSDWERRFWWLAAPSWFAWPDEFRLEHRARAVEAQIFVDWFAERLALEYIEDRCHEPKVIALTRLTYPACVKVVAPSPQEVLRTGLPDSWWSMEGWDLKTGRQNYRVTSTNDGKRVQGTSSDGSFGYCAGSWTENTRARFTFLPQEDVLRNPWRTTNDAWTFVQGPFLATMDFSAVRAFANATGQFSPGGEECRVPEMPDRFTPSYADSVRTLAEHQHAFFRRGARGDSATWVTAFLVASDSLLERAAAVPSGELWRFGLKGYRNVGQLAPPRDSVERRETLPPRPEWRSSLGVAWDSLIVGAEVLTPRSSAHDRILGRSRFVARPPSGPDQRVRMSDLLLHRITDVTPVALEGQNGAAALMLPTTRLARPSRIGVFWETYGTQPGEQVRCQLEVKPIRIERGFGERLRRVISLSGRDGGMRVEWTEWTPRDSSSHGSFGAWSQSRALDISALRPGDYDLVVSVIAADQQPFRVVRRFSITR
jgi:hypothetical protein